jgi:hypothetical protein
MEVLFLPRPLLVLDPPLIICDQSITELHGTI